CSDSVSEDQYDQSQIILLYTGSCCTGREKKITTCKCAHLRLACQTEPKPYYMSKLWWCGITLLGLGEVGNFTAYGFAPIALVAPLGCVSVTELSIVFFFLRKKTTGKQQLQRHINTFQHRGTLTVTGTYLLVTFAPNVPQELTARRVQNYLVSWPFLVYLVRIIIFCILLYFYKRKAVKHIVVLLMMVALLASLTVIAVKAVASMITLSAKGKMQLTYPVFYIMIVLMAISCMHELPTADCIVYLGFISQFIIDYYYKCYLLLLSPYTRSSQIYF
uniref:NIPA like domain containing 2 n=1 Tax=Strix occidentalis caurina TaxID=311401 RepID=A0A8D0EYS7_STROC